MTSSFFSLEKSKLGFFSLIVLASLLTSPRVDGRETEMLSSTLVHKVSTDELSSQIDSLHLTIRKGDNIYYLVMMKPLHIENVKGDADSLGEPLKKSKGLAIDENGKISLKTSRKQFKEARRKAFEAEKIKKMTTHAPSAYNEEAFQILVQ